MTLLHLTNLQLSALYELDSARHNVCDIWTTRQQISKIFENEQCNCIILIYCGSLQMEYNLCKTTHLSYVNKKSLSGIQNIKITHCDRQLSGRNGWHHDEDLDWAAQPIHHTLENREIDTLNFTLFLASKKCVVGSQKPGNCH